MDAIITFCPESISISDVQTRINNAVASKVSVSDVQRIVNTSLVDNSWPKTRTYSGSTYTNEYVSLPTNTGSVTVTSVAKWRLGSHEFSSQWTLPKSLSKGTRYTIGSFNQGSNSTHCAAIMFTGSQIRMWDDVSGPASRDSINYDITVSLTA